MTDDKMKVNDIENHEYENQAKNKYQHQVSWKEKCKSLMCEELSGLSKNQQKKLLKHKLFMETRPERRKEERERKKKKRALKKEVGLLLPENRRFKKRKMVEYHKLKVVIDLDFYDYMNDKDLRMIVNQIKSCYSENRKREHPLQFYTSSFSSKYKELFHKIQPGYISWDIKSDELHYLDLFEKDKLVYLSSDSENILDTLDEDKVYVIGGLVDHNQHKGLCHRLAQSYSVAHAQLPIDQFVKLKSRKVLTINHVFEILLNYSETKDWKEAFFKVLPNRKVATNLEMEGNSANNEEQSGICTTDQIVSGLVNQGDLVKLGDDKDSEENIISNGNNLDDTEESRS